ncbi:RNA polymerase sigma factor [Maribacter sp. 2307ULW6-5]|uniref:RNA polymerase sigma factor n=1 Tax=Maribacter sp. 2307ULW6-5 TaxID=3386275 RepID=UPI0039BCA763
MAQELYRDICDKFRFSKVYEQYAGDLGNFLYYKYGEALNPTDVMQDAFVKLWENCAKVKPDKVKSYLFTIANNMMLNAHKHQKVVFKHQGVKPKDYTNESPEFLMRKEEFLTRYEKVLAGLKEEHRVAFLLSKVEGKTHQAIADMLGVTKKVVEHRIYTAFNTLREQLEDFRLR